MEHGFFDVAHIKRKWMIKKCMKKILPKNFFFPKIRKAHRTKAWQFSDKKKPKMFFWWLKNSCDGRIFHTDFFHGFSIFSVNLKKNSIIFFFPPKYVVKPKVYIYVAFFTMKLKVKLVSFKNSVNIWKKIRPPFNMLLSKIVIKYNCN